MSKPLILLFGMPRSGTTWLGKIFDSHPQVLYRHEPDSWRKLSGIPLFPDVASAEAYSADLSEYAGGLKRDNSARTTTKLPIFSKRLGSPVKALMYKASVYASLALGRLSPTMAISTISPVSRTGAAQAFVTWKSIESLGRVGVLSRCLAPVKIIVLVRHPCGYIASVLKGEQGKAFVSSVPASEDYGVFRQLLESNYAEPYGLTETALKQLSAEERLAWRWLLTNEKALQDLQGRGEALVVRYEDICESPLEQARRMFSFVGLSWNEQTESFIGMSVSSNDAAYYSVHKNPLESAYKWRDHLSDEVQQQVMTIVKRSDRLNALYQGLSS